MRDLRQFNDRRGWLVELFRQDELQAEFFPAMTYISSTEPGVTRGPHEHVDQADLFCFLGPSNFQIRMWDNRPGFQHLQSRDDAGRRRGQSKVGAGPKGVVHAYRNVGEVHGIVINCPNRLYAGQNKKQPVDEIRHEDDPDTIYRMD